MVDTCVKKEMVSHLLSTVVRNASVVVLYRDWEVEVWNRVPMTEDKDHLNEMGIGLWFLGLQEGIEKGVRVGVGLPSLSV